jgi:hypothetical protein
LTVRIALRRTSAFLATLLVSVTAQAQLFRAYLASDGNDANPCTLAAPCRLLPAALAAVGDGGEIWMLDSANYNTASVTVGKSVSILAVPGAVGSVLAIGGPAIGITAPGLKVALRNLVIAPLPGGGGLDGIFMTGSSTLLIEHSLIANLSSAGVHVTGNGKVKISNTTIKGNEDFAVRLENGAAGEISGTQMLSNVGGGVIAYSGVAATTRANVSDSVISGGDAGAQATAPIAGGIARVVVTRCTIGGAINGIVSDTTAVGSAILTVSSSTIANNLNAGWSMAGAGAVINSLGNNHITDNNGANVGSLTLTPLQ